MLTVLAGAAAFAAGLLGARGLALAGASAARSRAAGLAGRPAGVRRPAPIGVVGAVAVALAAVVAAVGSGPVLPAALAVAGLAAPRAWRRREARRSTDRLAAGLPVALEAVAAGLRSGAGGTVALSEVAAATGGPLGADLRTVAAEVPAAGLAASLDAWARARPLPGVRLAVAALALSAEVGGAGAGALDGVALTLRQRRAADAEVQALATQARLSGLVLAVAPLGFAALTATVDGRTARFLLAQPAGQLCLVAGIGLDAVGAAWMARLTRVTA